ncbi:DUF4189 domain-containing protein [Falsiroseomonas sp.]|uniref:DUF4189 domain-containing protein n=1 Tax=Falsiroseomonas sp. TaxID=2870721 RepID=UPI003F713741
MIAHLSFPRGCQALALLVLFLPGLSGAALAQGGPPESASCQRQCAPQPRSGTPRDLQVCLVRCRAGEDFLSRQHQAGTAEASGRGAAPRGPRAATPGGEASLVAYAATSPSSGLGVSRRGERQAAHRMADRDCRRGNDQRACRLLLETRQRCIAVAHNLRGLGLVMTRAADTYTVLGYGVGDGATLVAAQGHAMQDCAARQEPGTTCLMAVSRCG